MVSDVAICHNGEWLLESDAGPQLVSHPECKREIPDWRQSFARADARAKVHASHRNAILETSMHNLLLIAVLLWFALLAPLKVTLATAASFALVTALIRYLARAMSGVVVSLADAVKAIGTSFIFLAIAIFTLLSFLKGSGVSHISGLPALAVFGAFLAAYVLGFQVSLCLSFGTSSVIALVSTAASTSAFFISRSIL